MRILVDLDSIVADFMGGIWPEYWRQTGHQEIGTKDVKTWDWQGIPGSELIRPIFTAPGFFAGLQPMPGAISALKMLQALGNEVFIVSAHCTDLSAAEKIGWCTKHLPFIDKENVVITKSKHIFRADVIIDDMPGNCEKFKAENSHGIALTIAYPYNDHPVYDSRFHDWEDSAVAWFAIVVRIVQFCPSMDLNKILVPKEKP
jgi:5'-nucleotidase